MLVQMVAKQGYVPWKVEKPFHLNNNGKETMIIGADIFHERRFSSIVSVCATMDKEFTQYYTANDV